MEKYVLGFAFKDKQVLLIEKKKPKWQAGLYNGLGGSIEPFETPLMAMIREFSEECGLDTERTDWEKFCVMKGEDWICHCFKTWRADIKKAQSTTEEKIACFTIPSIANIYSISNIPFLIHLALDNNAPKNVIIKY